MDLDAYLSLPNSCSAIDLARRIGVPPSLLSQWRLKVRPVPIWRCVPIERLTDGAVTRRDLRPDDWYLIWPELAESHSPIPTEQEPA